MGTIVLIVIAVLIIAILKNTKGSKEEMQWNVSAKPILTPNELEMFQRLEEALFDYKIFPQVALNQIIEVKNKKQDFKAWAKISQKSVDYVVCDPDLKIIAAVELNDKSHARTNRKKSDRDKSAALEAAGIRLITLESRAKPKGDEIRNIFFPPPVAPEMQRNGQLKTA